MKNQYYNYESIHELALHVKAVYPLFQVDDFVRDVMDKTWEAVIAGFPAGLNENAYIYFPDFVEVYGQDECNWDLSMAAIERYTQSSTSEFCVRPFIINHEERMMRQMAIWLRLEYGIEYVRANGKHSRKIFQISEISLKANQQKTYTKIQSFKDLSSRKHYIGTHSVTLIVNGTGQGTLDFEVLPAQ